MIPSGHASEFVNLQRGVWQGCPLSGILFVPCEEILAQAIKNDIIEIYMYNKKFTVSRYADDTTTFMSDTSLVENIFEILACISSIMFQA